MCCLNYSLKWWQTGIRYLIENLCTHYYIWICMKGRLVILSIIHAGHWGGGKVLGDKLYFRNRIFKIKDQRSSLLQSSFGAQGSRLTWFCLISGQTAVPLPMQAVLSWPCNFCFLDKDSLPAWGKAWSYLNKEAFKEILLSELTGSIRICNYCEFWH